MDVSSASDSVSDLPEREMEAIARSLSDKAIINGEGWETASSSCFIPCCNLQLSMSVECRIVCGVCVCVCRSSASASRVSDGRARQSQKA